MANNITTMKKSFLWIALAAIIMTGCKNVKGTTKVSATGSIYECLVVCPEAVYAPVHEVLEGDMPCLPQMEPYFTLTHVTNKQFDDFLKPTRNILIVDIDSVRYTSVKAKFSKDYWSHPQAIYRIQSPNKEAFLQYWNQYSLDIRDWFVRQEIDRQCSFYRASTNHDARELLQRQFHADIWLPEDYQVIMDTTCHLSPVTCHLFWACNPKGTARRDLVIYSYPYTDTNTFTLDYLCAKRDEVLGQFVTAQVPGSYMGTEYKIFPPELRQLKVQKDGFAYEVRGLWKIYNGEAMGGPFVSLTRLDEVNQRVITAEVFVYAAGQKKRNELRKAEAILYTLQLEQELNSIQAVEVKQ